MPWLSPEVAYGLQYITLPLEIFGLTLATIEVRFPALTRWMNDRIVAMHDEVERSDARWRAAHPRMIRIIAWERFHVPTPGWLQWVLMGLIVVTTAAALGTAALRLLPELEGTRDAIRELLNDFLLWVYIPLVTGILVLMIAIRFVVSFAQDRAVGTLGIVLASLGVAGEAYQFAVSVAG